ncbi:hypothetical protein MASR2M17_06580 [Aminivibrio sp.]
MTLSYFLYKAAGAFVTLPGSLILLCLAASLYFLLSRRNHRCRRVSPVLFPLFLALLLFLLSFRYSKLI